MFRKQGDKWQFEVAPLDWKAPDTRQDAETTQAASDYDASDRSDSAHGVD